MPGVPKVASAWQSDRQPAVSTGTVQRLQTRAQYQAVLAGEIVSRGPHFVLYRLFPGGTGGSVLPQRAAPVLLMGALIPKRCARRAVTRNLLKRQIYAVTLLFARQLLPAAYVVRLRMPFDSTQFVSATSRQLGCAARTELAHLLSRAQGAAPQPLVTAL